MTMLADRLNTYISEVRDRPFQWHVWDCFMFTNGAFKAMHGRGFADDWVGQYTKDGLYLKRDQLRKVFEADTLVEALDKKLERSTSVPKKGALVTTDRARKWVIGEALGISIGAAAVFVSKSGLSQFPIEYTTNSWVLDA